MEPLVPDLSLHMQPTFLLSFLMLFTDIFKFFARLTKHIDNYESHETCFGSSNDF